ncbi:MAG: cell division protein FtsX [Bdellovibrionales bacterium]
MAAPKKKALWLTTYLILTASLSLVGLLFVLVKSAHLAALDSQKNLKLEIFFKQDLSNEDELKWVSEVQGREEVLRTQVVSQEQAQIDFKDLMKNEWGSLVEEASLLGRLPASVVVEFQKDLSAMTRQRIAEEIQASAAQFQSFDGSLYQKDWSQWFADYAIFFQRAAWAFGGLMFVILFFLISNLIRSQVLSRSEEIEILSFLGATHWQIQKPFVLQAMALVSLSALSTYALLIYLLHLSKVQVSQLTTLLSPDLLQGPSPAEFAILLSIVVALAAFAARLCVQERIQS